MDAIIFDVDGTLVDSVDLHAKAWQDAFAHFGHRIGFDEIRSQIGKGGDQLMPVFLPKEELDQVGEELERFRGDVFKKNYLPAVKAFPKVRELFEVLLLDDWKLGLASSAKGDELATYKRLCRIDDLLDAETSSDDAEKSKPFPDIFQAAAAKLRVAAERCYVIGDSPYDAQAAKAAGMKPIGFLCGGFPADVLEKAGMRALYRGPEDLLARFDRSEFRRERPVSA